MRALTLRTLTLSVALFAPTAVLAQTTWTGAVSTSWSAPGNWSPAAVPGAGTDVIVPAAANQPSTYVVDPTCASLQIESGASMTLGSGFDLTVAGALVVDGSLAVTAATSSITVGGDLSIDGSFTARGGTVQLTGTGTLGGTGTTTFNNLVVSGGTRTAVGDTVVLADAVIEGGATLDLDGFTMQCAGNWTSSAPGVSVTGGGTVEFTDTGLVTTGGNSLPNVAISGGVRSVNTSAVAGDLSMSAGEILILDDVVVTVGGNALLAGGVLGWASGFAGLDVLDVAGDVTVTTPAGATSSASRLRCGGNWTSSPAFAPAAGWVELDGGGATSVGGAGPTFANLRVTGGTKTLSAAAVVLGDLDVGAGTTFDTAAAVDVGGSVTLGGVTSSWLLGASTHTVAGSWTSSGGSATGAGTVHFDGPGSLATGGGSIANVLVSVGTRTVLSSAIAGDLSMTGGALDVQADQAVTVGGNLALSGGTLSFQAGGPILETLDVEGDATITATAGTFGSGVRLRCAGDWSSSAAFAPAAGIVSLDGGTAATIGGAGTGFANLTIASGSKTLTSPATVTGALVVASGATLDTDAALDVDGSVTLGDGTASWDLGASTHTVAGGWTSGGASAVGSGLVHFDGTGTVAGGGGSIANVLTSTGTRQFSSTVIAGDLDQTGGVVRMLTGQTLAVGGNATFGGGTLEWPGATDALFDTIDVEGDVTITSASGPTSADSRLRCAGNWTSEAAFAPASGLAILDGPAPVTLGGTAPTFARLTLAGDVVTVVSPVLVAGDLTVSSGALLDADAVLAVDGSVSLGDGTAGWDLGTLTHTVAGGWSSSGGSATGGIIEFDGTGGLATGGGSIAAVRVTGGTRTASNASVAGDLELLGGTLEIAADQTLSVGGQALLTAGTLAWSAAANGTPDVLDVAGDVTLTAAAGTTGADSRLVCAGNWSSTSAFTPASGTVVLDGGAATTLGGADPVFADLSIENGTLTVLSAVSVQGSLSVASGATLDADAVLDVDGDVTLGDGTASWDLGALEHTVAGSWTAAGGSATGTGTIHFDGDGGVAGGGGSIPNVLTSAGLRELSTVSVTGDLEQTGGDVRVLDGQLVSVGGDATFAGGTLGWVGTPNAVLDVLDVEGNVVVGSAAGPTSTDSRLFCGGNWTSTAAFTPAAGLVVLDGGAPTTVDGAGLTLAGLRATGGTRTILVPATLLSLDVGATAVLVTDAAIDVDGNVTLGTAPAEWQLGALAHTVSGTWTSSGGSATGAGTIEFDGAGAVATGGGSIANVLVSAGTRTASTSLVTGNLEMTGGTLAIGNNQVLTVNGDCSLTGGQLSWVAFANGFFDVFDVDGDVTVAVPVAGESTDARFLCGGDWTASSAFQPALATVVLDGAVPATIDGSEPAPSVFFAELVVSGGPKTFAAAATVAGHLQVAGTGSALVAGTAPTLTANRVTVLGSLEIGSSTVLVSGNWTSSAGGASVTGTGAIEFTGLGTLATGANFVPNVRVSSGQRTVQSSKVTGTLELTGGGISISDGSTLSVGGDATLSGGLLSFVDSAAGVETLSVSGSIVLAATAGAMSGNSRIVCGGDWTSSAAWSPTAGRVDLSGPAPTTVSGAGTTLPDVRISGSTRTLLDPATAAALEIVSGAGLLTSATLDVDGAVVLGDGTASWDLGGGTHAVGGGWTSSGASATNGTIAFDGDGVLDTGAGSVANVLVAAGARDAQSSAVTGDLSLTGGTLTIGDDQTLTVAGDAALSAGTLAFWPGAAGGDDVLDVEGSVTCTAAAGTTTSRSLIRCAGDWTSNAAFAPASGAVELDGPAPTLLSGAGPGFDPAFSTLRLIGGVRSAGTDMSLAATGVTIASGAAFETGDRAVTLPASTVTVNGTLDVQPGGTLALGPATAVVVPAGAPGGTLSIVGTGGEPASIVGASGGGYLVNVDGTLAAGNFLVRDPGATGFIVGTTATIAPFPHDLRGGTFSHPSPAAGSALLDIRRGAPAEFRYVRFEDPGAVGTFNVRTLSGAAISFTNSDGDFSGTSFEQDPFMLVSWDDDATELTSFLSVPGADVIDLEWTSAAEVDIDAWILQRGPAPSGPFTDLVEVPPAGPGTYPFSDTTVVPLQAYIYRIAQRLTHGEVQVLAERFAKAWSAAPPPNFLTVGPSAEYPDIGSAILDLPPGLPVISVAAGTYPAFTIGPGVASTVRILADGSGPVVIDTSGGPVLVSSLSPLSVVEMSDLEIGDALSPSPGVVVQDCLGVVVLDELVVHGGTGQPGVHVSNSKKVAIQRTDMDGSPGLLADETSVLVASKGTLSDLEVADSSHVRLCEMPTSSTVEPGSTLTEIAGVMSDIDAPEFVALGDPFTLTFSGTPLGTWHLVVSVGIGWQDFTGGLWQMVSLANLGQSVLMISGPLGGGGVLPLNATLPADVLLYGFPLVMQSVVIQPGSGFRRWSNVISIVGIG